MIPQPPPPQTPPTPPTPYSFILAKPAGKARLKQQTLSPSARRIIKEAAEEAIAGALATSYWEALRRSYERYREFRVEWETSEKVRMGHDEGVILWITHLRVNGLATTSALQYLVNVTAGLKRFEGWVNEGQLLRDFRRGLKRDGGLKPAKQAKPATLGQVTAAIAKETRPLVKLAIGMMWSGAARASDVLRLSPGEITPTEGTDTITIVWTQTTSDHFRLGKTTGMILQPHLRQILISRLQDISGEQPVFPEEAVTYRSIAIALKHIDQELTPHSLRRGALTTLARQGVPLDKLQLISRHSSVDAVLRYVPAAVTQRVSETGSLSRRLVDTQ